MRTGTETSIKGINSNKEVEKKLEKKEEPLITIILKKNPPENPTVLV